MPSGIYERYPPEILEYMKERANSQITRRQMYEDIKAKICDRVTFDYIRGLYYRNRLPYKPMQEIKNSNKSFFTEEQAEWVASIIPGRPSSEIAEMVNKKFGLKLTIKQIRGWKKNHKTPSGYDSRWRAGQTSWVKGKTWADYMSPESQKNSLSTCFKKGNVPANYKPVGTITRRDAYWYIKISEKPAKWEQLHRVRWEEAYGPIPEGMSLMFLDGNTLNCDLSNLRLTEKATIGTANTHFGLTNDPELNEAILRSAEIMNKVAKLKKKKGRKDDGVKGR